MIPPCLILSNIRYVSTVKWSNPEKGVAPSPTPQCSSYWKGSLQVALNYSRQLYFLLLWYKKNYISYFSFSKTGKNYLNILLKNDICLLKDLEKKNYIFQASFVKDDRTFYSFIFSSPSYFFVGTVLIK